MHDTSAQAQIRIARFMRERITPALYRDSRPLTVSAWTAPGEPVPFAEAIGQDFSPFEIGQLWGAPWSTVWFHVTGSVPPGWLSECTRVELVIDLGFTTAHTGFQAEGLVYASDGTIIKGVEPLNQYVTIHTSADKALDYYIEAASNPDVAGGFDFSPTLLGDRATAGSASVYQLRRVDVALLDLPVWELAQDFHTLTGLMVELSAELPRRAEILRALEEAIDSIDPHNVSATALAGREALAGVLAMPAAASAHRVHAVGHAHIDSAWLWPVRETVRKIARTFSNVLTLIDEVDDFVFAASSAQQYAWVKENYPELFERVRVQVAAGRFAPVGGMWVESDTNMPGGESLVRQFVLGKKFFLKEFGIEPLEVWLPDSFGYSAALPQIIAAAGSRWFLTQKLSWNDTNAFPHHTFLWEGIDGTRVLTHFPPVGTYSAELSGSELARAQLNFADKGPANTSLIPFGWGDGGGGPTREMIAAALRAASLEGSPTVTLSNPSRFFEVAEAEYDKPPVWSGELYLEFHRGSYTSQARTKRGNRRSEHLLREAELWATVAAIRNDDFYPYGELERAWQTVLLQQFHDILPGTSIAWVHQEAERNYATVAVVLEEIIASSIGSLAGTGDLELSFNASPHALDAVPPLGASKSKVTGGVSITRSGQDLRLTNQLVSVIIDSRGLLTSIRDRVADREVLSPESPANLLQLFRDTPDEWDAWNIDRHYARNQLDLVEADSVSVVEIGPERVGVRVVRSFGASTVTQLITLAARSSAIDIETHIDWHEKQKLLKLAFPLDLHADRAASEIQFGHVFRPTHMNTSWDMARFETVAHRWVHVAEAGYGVAIANDSTYGHDIGRTTREGGGTTTSVRLSLLRAPLYPDPQADQGKHTMSVSLRVGASIADAVNEGYRINLPLRVVRGGHAVEPFLTIDNPAVVIESVKLAEDRSGDVIVRLYEAHGSRARARLNVSFGYRELVQTDLLERPLARQEVVDSAEGILVQARPFQLFTLRFRRGKSERLDPHSTTGTDLSAGEQ